ncbi:MAG: hypothetical protein L7H12_05365, partial [Sulfolobales archaeon]|nr:hypothetical protein [Sulfolobales archaeon]MCG2908346.1 hypothetical protein [Sulfolobales archaeon]
MVYESFCEVCWESRETKRCPIKNLNVCVYCCTACEIRSTCEARVWFRSLVPVTLQRTKQKAKS